jgi:hypothetical protein
MDRDDDFDDELDGDDFEDAPRLVGPESALVRQDLKDLDRFEEAFAPEGFRGVAIFCQDCQEEHYYPWGMMRENLQALLDTGETPVHEPAFAPDPDDYVPWEYARGYVDALTDVGVPERAEVEGCPRCRWRAGPGTGQASFCPRCGTALLRERMRRVLIAAGLDEGDVEDLLAAGGLPG